jgi:hypothetical protein
MEKYIVRTIIRCACGLGKQEVQEELKAFFRYYDIYIAKEFLTAKLNDRKLASGFMWSVPITNRCYKYCMCETCQRVSKCGSYIKECIYVSRHSPREKTSLCTVYV